MKRSTPLRRKTPLRSKKPLWMCSKRAKSKLRPTEPVFWKRPKKPMRKVSKAKQKRLREEYYPAHREFLSKPENRFCGICLAKGQNPPNRSTEVHHVRGRAGTLLSDPRGFIPSCYPCRKVPHDNPRWAREVGILAPAHLWNVPFDPK